MVLHYHPRGIRSLRGLREASEGILAGALKVILGSLDSLVARLGILDYSPCLVCLRIHYPPEQSARRLLPVILL